MPASMNHTNCDHPATKAGRAACRKATAKAEYNRNCDIDLLLETFRDDITFDPDHWVFYAARRFADYNGTDRREAADAILTYFYPSGDEAADARRKANGYTITTNPLTMRSITLRAAS